MKKELRHPIRTTVSGLLDPIISVPTNGVCSQNNFVPPSYMVPQSISLPVHTQRTVFPETALPNTGQTAHHSEDNPILRRNSNDPPPVGNCIVIIDISIEEYIRSAEHRVRRASLALRTRPKQVMLATEADRNSHRSGSAGRVVRRNLQSPSLRTKLETLTTSYASGRLPAPQAALDLVHGIQANTRRARSSRTTS